MASATIMASLLRSSLAPPVLGTGERLALWAHVRPASGDPDAHDGGAADGAGLPLAAEDTGVPEVAALPAEEVHVVGEAGAAVLDGLPDDTQNGVVEPAHLGGSQGASGPSGMDACVVQHLVRVDVAQPGHR